MSEEKPLHMKGYLLAIWKAIKHEHYLRKARRNCRADRYVDDDGVELTR